MIIKPRVRGFICVTSHPTGCELNVEQQVRYIQERGALRGAGKRVLILGASAGYGLAARITSAFACGAATIGVHFERPAEQNKTATAGWYNSAAFHRIARRHGLYARSINDDAFSDETKQKVIEAIKRDLGQVDLIIYSLAAPRRRHPRTGETFHSTLKPIGKTLTLMGFDLDKERVKQHTLEPATQEEIAHTVAVMGGEDWQMWIDALDEAGVLADRAKTTAFTYIGDKATQDIYWNGTIGAAKKDLDRAALAIRARLANRGGDARVAALKAVVTQASAAIPVMPIYLSLLFKVMKEQGTHETCIEQAYRLYDECLYSASPRLDDEGRYRVDDRELHPATQRAVEATWGQIDNDNFRNLSDFNGYKSDFRRLFGFDLEGIDYDSEVSPIAEISDLL